MSRLDPTKLDARITEGHSLAEWRATRCQTQRELANEVGVSHVVVSRWERGEAPIPVWHLTTLFALGWRGPRGAR